MHRIHSGYRAAGRAEKDHQASEAKTLERTFEGSLAHRVVDHIDPGAGGDAPDFMLKIHGFVKNCMLGPSRTREVRLFLRGNGCDDLRAGLNGHLDQKKTDAA